jgi:hypothetical protein
MKLLFLPFPSFLLFVTLLGFHSFLFFRPSNTRTAKLPVSVIRSKEQPKRTIDLLNSSLSSNVASASMSSSSLSTSRCTYVDRSLPNIFQISALIEFREAFDADPRFFAGGGESDSEELRERGRFLKEERPLTVEKLLIEVFGLTTVVDVETLVVVVVWLDFEMTEEALLPTPEGACGLVLCCDGFVDLKESSTSKR